MASRRQLRHPPVLTAADRVVLYVLVGLGVALLFYPHGDALPRAAVVRGVDGFRVVVPLSEERTLEVPGPLGTTLVEVGDGAARVASSPCPRQVCVSSGAISHSGDVVVCAPNGVAVRLVGGRRGELDGGLGGDLDGGRREELDGTTR